MSRLDSSTSLSPRSKSQFATLNFRPVKGLFFVLVELPSISGVMNALKQRPKTGLRLVPIPTLSHNPPRTTPRWKHLGGRKCLFEKSRKTSTNDLGTEKMEVLPRRST